MEDELTYQIKITPEISYMDKDAKIEISGKPDEPIQLRLSTSDYYNINGDLRVMEVGSKWEGVIETKLDESGRIVFDASLFTSMKLVKGEKSKLEQDLTKLQENRTCHITIQLNAKNRLVAETIHKRVYCDDSIISKNVISDQLLGRYFTRKGSDKRPAILVVSGSDGRIEKAQAIAQCLAMKGFSAFALCYFGMEHVNADLDRIPMESIESGIRWLMKQPEVDADRIGIYGRSKGGEMGMLAATLFPQIKYVVANTPSLYVHEGIIRGVRTSGHSSWKYKGKELPYVKASKRSLFQLIINMIKKNSLALCNFYTDVTWKKANARYPGARILIEKSNASFLLIASDTDAIWPSETYIKEAGERMKEGKKEHNCRQLCYAGAGHMLTLPYQPIPNCEEYGGTLTDGIKATVDSWNETVAFFKQMQTDK